MPDINNYKVSVMTWGTKHGDSKLTKQVDNKLYGGNVGHAAIKLTFPADERGEQLVKQYCKDMPKELITKQSKTTKKEIFVRDKKGNIKFNKEGFAVKEEEIKESNYYELYFSFWPGNEEDISFSYNNFESDKKLEREGVNVPWHEDANPAFIQRRHNHGLFDGGFITLGSAMTVKYPKHDVSLKSLKKPEWQKTILKYVQNPKNKINKGNYEKIKTVPQSNNEMLVNWLSLYEEQWNLANHYKDQINFLQKTNEKITNKQKKLTDKQQNDIEKNKASIIFMLEKQKKLKEHIDNIKKQFAVEFKENIENYLSFGREPDDVVDLPLVDSNNELFAESSFLGLELEPMLKQMKIISEDNKDFNLWQKNCSSTTLSIINSGITEENRSWMGQSVDRVTRDFKDDKAWIFKMFTPQSIYNSSRQLEQNIVRHNRGDNVPNMSVFKKILIKIRDVFKIKNNKNIVSANTPIICSRKVEVSTENQEFNNACKKELEGILKQTNELIRFFANSKTAVAANSLLMDKKDDAITALTNRYIVILSQMSSPANKSQEIVEIGQKIINNAAAIRDFLHNPDGRQFWKDRYSGLTA